jgi:hypothetical protein
MGHNGIILNCRIAGGAELKNLAILPILVAAFVVLSTHGASAQTKNPRDLADAAMMKADRDFNQAAADRSMERFLALVSETRPSTRRTVADATR